MADQIGEAGDVKNLSQASSSTNFYPNTLRLLFYEHYFFLKIFLWLFFIGVLGVFGGFLLWPNHSVLAVICWVISGIVLIPPLLAVALFFRVFAMARMNFKNGLLTAASVFDEDRKRLIHIAVISTGGSSQDYLYGIQLIQYDAFPKKWMKNTQRFACASTFSDNVPHPNSWHSFFPVPVVLGTTNSERIAECLGAVEEDSDGLGSYFDILNRFQANYAIPEEESNGLYVCNAEGRLLETRALMENGKNPPPLVPR